MRTPGKEQTSRQQACIPRVQLINNLFGGSLHQDLLDAGIATHPHGIKEAEENGSQLVTNGWLSQLHDGLTEAQFNSIHHQGVDRLGAGLSIEAYSQNGGVKAIRHQDYDFIVEVQWHPEFHGLRYPSYFSPNR